MKSKFLHYAGVLLLILSFSLLTSAAETVFSTVDEQDNSKLSEFPAVETETLVSKEISIYPIPADEFFILSSGISFIEIEVFDALGKKVVSHINKDQRHKVRINVGKLPKGIYIVRVTYPDGEKITRRLNIH